MSGGPRTQPDPNLTTVPPGIPYIIGNEVAERFSFYGMKGILTVFMMNYMLDANGAQVAMTEEKAKAWYHAFSSAAYFFPLLGGLWADVLWGKYKTILYFSLFYCVGHACLAVMDVAPLMGMGMQPWLILGMIFIAFGAGAIKPCVSAHVGDQFGSGNKHMLSSMFNWFYFSINLGAALSTALTPKLLTWYGPWAAFGLPGILMALATYTFWLGRNRFVHIQPAVATTPSVKEAFRKYWAEVLSDGGGTALVRLAPIFLLFVPMFWAIFDQSGGAWVQQGSKMNGQIFGAEWLSWLPDSIRNLKLEASQMQAANPFFILAGIPFFAYVVYPFLGRFFEVTPLRKIGIGFAVTMMSCLFSAWIEAQIDAGETPNLAWQALGYVILTSAEIMVSIVTLEFAYTQSPPKLKSLIMGIYFLGVSLGNAFTGIVNFVLDKMRREDGSVLLEGASYYMFFAILMGVFGIGYLLYAKYLYRGKTYIQGESEGAVS